MGEKIDVVLADAFQNGNTDTTYFRDLPKFTEADVKALMRFITKLAAGDPLPGKNKPSWLDDHQEEIPGSEDYRDNGYWHYHAGVDYPQTRFSMTHGLKLNVCGATSPNVIHYYKNSDSKITVVGYSPVHDPFPRANDPDNPLFVDDD